MCIKGRIMASKCPQKPTDQTKKANFQETKQSSKNHSGGGRTKELGSLEFSNPGPKFLKEFTLEKGVRDMRKTKRKTYKNSYKKNQLYDKNGILLDDGRNLCDCLDPDCSGCHFPCPKCSSEKCGLECRNNRCSYFDEIAIEGKEQTLFFPLPYSKDNT